MAYKDISLKIKLIKNKRLNLDWCLTKGFCVGYIIKNEK